MSFDPVVRLADVTRVHGDGPQAVPALRGVSMEVAAGELVAVMGPSGSGKSTLLNLAGGLDLPTSGAVVVEGTPLTSLSAKELAALRRRHVGYVFQDLNLIPSLTAVENVMLPRELDGVRARTARSEALEILAEVGLAEPGRFPDELSGGQRQRVAIARALAGERRLILADEPTGALDTPTGDDILRLLRARCDAGAAVLLVTHEPRYAAWADRVVFLRDGEITDSTEAALESAR
ncbi:ABC transporter ATP-binding protein [Planomonospora venezuelensis]|uniref:Putative ABC transport system ATP-binding protein n=1 Tax=Planomonospora venezuelensis TaxID=1999 RepID=A0A841D3U1_PLAVE|nr:ABC transporter ATP-binding protein [Planomonospora venezuelensis]MBB5963058.1 putative ABC transport system ATP-binding protein [Planomonospora venezuelensis]GIN00625.1 macrolide ABC transporter ATP-binding protein [Planomonospora venezuelensis]